MRIDSLKIIKDAKAEKVGLLRNGVKANVLQMSNRDAQFVDQMIFQRQEAALWLMLESILGDDTSQSYNTEEQKSLAYLKHCLANWLTRWEQECEYKLLSPREFESDEYYMKFNTGALLRTDSQTTASIGSTYIASRVYNPNEWREKLDENPYEGGDDYENPNVTPGGGGDSPPNNAAARLERLMKIEQRQVNKFLDRGDSFEIIDNWYDTTFIRKLTAAVEELGGDFAIAQNHCVESLNYIKRKPDHFDLTGSAELLAKEIEKCLT